MLLPNGYDIDREMESEMKFEKGPDFEAITKAEYWLKDNGYSRGSMQREAPIGIAKGSVTIWKWRNISREEHKILDGVIVPEDGGSFRDRSCKIIIFKKAKNG